MLLSFGKEIFKELASLQEIGFAHKEDGMLIHEASLAASAGVFVQLQTSFHLATGFPEQIPRILYLEQIMAPLRLVGLRTLLRREARS